MRLDYKYERFVCRGESSISDWIIFSKIQDKIPSEIFENKRE